MAVETGVTKEFLERAFKTEIDRFDSGLGSNLGDGYMCSMFKATVWTKAEPEVPINIVIKCYPDNESRRAMLDQGNVFTIELRFYDTIIPEFQRMQEEVLPKDKRFLLPFAPFIYGNYVPTEEREALGRRLHQLDNCIIMPDLRVKSNGAFQVRDRFLGFDLDHQRLAIEAQATLHAFSWVYKCRKGEKLIKSFPFLDSNIGEMWKSFLQTIASSVTAFTKLFAEERPDISEGFERLSGVFSPVYGMYFDFDGGQKERGLTKDNVTRVLGPVVENEEPWDVLLHGDCWSNNLMFRYDEVTGKPIEVYLIDLQIGREGDPMSDMCYSLFVNAESQLRKKHLTSILHTYYDRFTEICDAFSAPYLPGWSFEELWRRFRRTTLIGGAQTSMLPFILRAPDQLENLDEAFDKIDDGSASTDPMDAMNEYFNVDKVTNNMHPKVLPRIRDVMEDLLEYQVL